ncbi:MAG: NADH-quinone oxidoreductase subunit L [Nitrososphaeria archaeon]|nr:NADH-quinone oxidoreductase subunit L [Conexivisphaerales archaeon]
MIGSILFLIWGLPMLAAGLGLVLRKQAPFISILTIAISFILSAISPFIVSVPSVISYPWFMLLGLQINFGMLFDGLSIVMGSVVAFVSLLIAIYSYRYMYGDWGHIRYWYFFSFFVGSMLLLVYASNLIVLLIGWEGTTLASYALIGHWYTDEDEERWVGDKGRYALGVPMWFTPSQSGVRAMIVTSFGDIGFITGIGMLYKVSGTLSILGIEKNITQIITSLNNNGLLIPFLIAFTMGAFAKSAQFPFHEWLVTAMTGPSSISALIHAATMVNAGVYLLLRFVPILLQGAVVAGLYSSLNIFFTYVLVIGAFTAFMMASMAIASNELKLILAYSTASQIGYMFMGIGAAYFISTPSIALFASLSHFISQALFKAAMFMAAGALIEEFSSRYIKDMAGAYSKMKLTAIAFLLASLSLSGIPPFSGFWDKDLILESTLQTGNVIAYLLGVIGAFLTAFYIFRAFTMVFVNKGDENLKEKEVKEAHPVMLWPYFVLGLLSLLFGIFWYFPYGGLSALIYYFVYRQSVVQLPTTSIYFSPLDVGISVTIALIGLLSAFYIYRNRREIVLKSDALKKLRDFLYDRWYINSIYYKAFVYSLNDFASALRKSVEFGSFDRFYHNLVPRFILGTGERLRKFQHGDIGKYLLVLLAGALVLLVIGFVMLVLMYG